MTLLLVNLGFAALAGLVAWRWRAARWAVEPVASEGVDIRIRIRPPDEELVDEWVRRALREVDPAPVSRTSGPVLGDAKTVVELPADRADAVIAALVGVLLAEDYVVHRTKGRRVRLRRGSERVVVEIAASA